MHQDNSYLFTDNGEYRGVQVHNAMIFGLNEAMILNQIHYWLNKRLNEREGRFWVYNSYDDWQKQFPFFSSSTIERAINKLQSLGVLISKEFEKFEGKRRKWYTINYKLCDKIAADHKVIIFERDPSDQNEHMGDPSRQNEAMGGASRQNEATHHVKMRRSYIEQRLPSKTNCSSRQAAQDSPKDLEDEIVDWIVEAVPQAKDMDMSPIKNWLKNGADFEKDIKPAVQKASESLEKNSQKLGGLHYFDKFIQNRTAARLKPPKTKAETFLQETKKEAKPLDAPKQIPEFEKRDDKALSWRQASQTIKKLIGEPKYISWISPLKPVSFEKGVITLRAGTKFLADQVRTHLSEDILAACENANSNVREVRIVTG